MPLDNFSTFLKSKAFCLKQPYELDSDDHWIWSLFMICYYRGSSYAVVTRHEKWLKLINSGQLAEYEKHRLRNIVNVMSVTIRLSARDETDPLALAEQIDRRLRALGDTHFQTFADPSVTSMPLHGLIAPILADGVVLHGDTLRG